MSSPATTPRGAPRTGTRSAGSAPPALDGANRARTARALLACGAAAGPVYVLVSLAHAVARDGFDPTRHSWSLLALGSLGWLHIITFELTGVLVLALAVGLRRALRGGSAATWAPLLLGAYGASLLAAGGFRADPAFGFPPGTPDEPAAPSWHGTLHLAAGGIGFICLFAACLVVARRFAAERRTDWAWCSRLTGVLLLAGFAAVASGSPGWPVVAFTVAVVVTWAWLSALAISTYRSLPTPGKEATRTGKGN